MAGGIITTGNHPKLLWPGIHAIWGNKYAEHLKQYTDLFDMKDSSRAYEEDVQITGFQLAPIKAQGANVTYDSEFQGVVTRYQHIAYALGYQVTFEELQDNLYEEVSGRRAENLAFSMNQTIENVAAGLYNGAFSTASFTTGDGASLVSASHVNATGGTYSNALTPSADLSEAALEDLTIQIMGVQNDRGLLVSILPKSLIVPRQEWYNANRILKSVLQSNTANNNINVLNATNVFPEGVKLNLYLTSAHAFFIRTNAMNGMTMFWRNHPDFKQDNDFNSRNALASSYMRFSVGCTDPRGIFGSNGP